MEVTLKSGNLSKRGGGFPYLWQDRTFNLYANRIEYLSGTTLKGSVAILATSTVETVATYADKPFAFQLKTKEDVLLMTGNSAEHTAEWINAIEDVISRADEEDSDDEHPPLSMGEDDYNLDSAADDRDFSQVGNVTIEMKTNN